MAVAVSAASGTGTIQGHVRLSGPAPGNPIIRMGMDPMCAKLNAGPSRPLQQIVVRGADGGLANVFVTLKGTFANVPPPGAPVVIRQVKCVDAPRVVAKGRGLIAQRIKALGREYDIPTVENVPLAQSLYRLVNVGQDIPMELYKAVAEVLAYVYNARKRFGG